MKPFLKHSVAEQHMKLYKRFHSMIKAKTYSKSKSKIKALHKSLAKAAKSDAKDKTSSATSPPAAPLKIPEPFWEIHEAVVKKNQGGGYSLETTINLAEEQIDPLASNFDVFKKLQKYLRSKMKSSGLVFARTESTMRIDRKEDGMPLLRLIARPTVVKPLQPDQPTSQHSTWKHEPPAKPYIPKPPYMPDLPFAPFDTLAEERMFSKRPGEKAKRNRKKEAEMPIVQSASTADQMGTFSRMRNHYLSAVAAAFNAGARTALMVNQLRDKPAGSDFS